MMQEFKSKKLVTYGVRGFILCGVEDLAGKSTGHGLQIQQGHGLQIRASRVFDVSGQLLYSIPGNSENGIINISALAAGVYIIQLRFNNELRIARFVKQ